MNVYDLLLVELGIYNWVIPFFPQPVTDVLAIPISFPGFRHGPPRFSGDWKMIHHTWMDSAKILELHQLSFRWDLENGCLKI
jgi:hypothetical protein